MTHSSQFPPLELTNSLIQIISHRPSRMRNIQRIRLHYHQSDKISDVELYKHIIETEERRNPQYNSGISFIPPPVPPPVPVSNANLPNPIHPNAALIGLFNPYVIPNNERRQHNDESNEENKRDTSITLAPSDKDKTNIKKIE